MRWAWLPMIGAAILMVVLLIGMLQAARPVYETV